MAALAVARARAFGGAFVFFDCVGLVLVLVFAMAEGSTRVGLVVNGPASRVMTASRRRDDGVQKRDDGAEKRDDGVPKRDDGVAKRDDGASSADDGASPGDDGVSRHGVATSPDGEVAGWSRGAAAEKEARAGFRS